MKVPPRKTSAACSIKVQSTGGPREGSGGAVVDAIWAAAVACRAWERGETGAACTELGAGGKATGMHKAQSIVPWLGTALSVPSTATSLSMPPLVQTSSVDLGATKEDAIATPKDKANHTSTKRVRWRSCLKACMARSIVAWFFSRNRQVACGAVGAGLGRRRGGGGVVRNDTLA